MNSADQVWTFVCALSQAENATLVSTARNEGGRPVNRTTSTETNITTCFMKGILEGGKTFDASNASVAEKPFRKNTGGVLTEPLCGGTPRLSFRPDGNEVIPLI